MGRLVVTVVMMVVLVPSAALATTRPRYDVPAGFTRCPHAIAWHGFFKWSSERHASCRVASRFMRRYAAHATGPRMPRHVARYRCRIHAWRDADGLIYASRHVCPRVRVTI